VAVRSLVYRLVIVVVVAVHQKVQKLTLDPRLPWQLVELFGVVEQPFPSVRHLSERERLLVGHKAEAVTFVQSEEIRWRVEQEQTLVQFGAQPVTKK
jgi:hypothetical protein